MLYKTWNVRDAPKEELRLKADKLYHEIEAEYKMIKKISNIEDAKKILDQIWRMKSQANDIQLELIRREYNNET